MPRRNHRADVPAPLDLTSAPELRVGRPARTRAERDASDRETAERQRQARIRSGIDWDICLVPGCGKALTIYGRSRYRPEERDPEKVLPLCLRHQLVVWQNLQAIKHEPVVIETHAMMVQREREQEAARREAEKASRAASKTGHIYYLRMNGLIKVGWSRDLYDRLRAYGPEVELLCHHKGSRDDETSLHRNLRPFLARGREWYEDTPGMRDIIARAVALHGPPSIKVGWTKPTPPTIRPHASARR